MKRAWRSYVIAVLVVGLPACPIPNPGPTIDKALDQVSAINDTLSNAVTALQTESSAWQGTIKDLQTKLASDAKDFESQLASDVQSLITQLDIVVKDGVQFAQETFNCQIDIFTTHARIALQNLQVDFLNKWNFKGVSNRPHVDRAPIVCSANPDHVDVATWNLANVLTLSGTDLNLLDTAAPSVYVVRADGSAAPLANMGNRITNYRFALNVPAMITQNLLAGAVQLQVRWNGQRVNRNEIPVVSCGMLGGACCRGVCTPGSACVNNLCSRCGGLGQACCPTGPACTSANLGCINAVCSQCGDVGQPCCPTGSACTARNSGCLTGRCTTCPPPPTQKSKFTKFGEQCGPNCFGRDETRTYGGACDPGFHRLDPIGMQITDACDVCTAVASWASGNTSDCTVNIHYRTPNDCGKYIKVDLTITEIQNSGPHPNGCP